MDIHYQPNVSWFAVPSRRQFTSGANDYHIQKGCLTFLFSFTCERKRWVKIFDL